MYFDSHVHSRVSPDSEMDPVQAADALLKKGLGIVFTEHVDYVTPLHGKDTKATDAPQTTGDFVADLDAYPSTYGHLRNDTTLIGVEIGLTAAFLPLNRQTALEEDWDFVLGSIHYIDGFDVYSESDAYIAYVGKQKVDPYARMLTYTREMIEICDFIQALGHIDYISRYSPLREKLVRCDKYAAEYHDLFSLMAQRDLALEINTARFGRTAGLESNWAEICRCFKKAGGRYVTIGSDAHECKNLGRYHNEAREIARETGLQTVYFKKRRIFFCE